MTLLISNARESSFPFLFAFPRLVLAQQRVAVLAVVLRVVQRRAAERDQAEGPAPGVGKPE